MKGCFWIDTVLARLLAAAAHRLCLITLVRISDDVHACPRNVKMGRHPRINSGRDEPYVSSFDITRSPYDFEDGWFFYCGREQVRT